MNAETNLFASIAEPAPEREKATARKTTIDFPTPMAKDLATQFAYSKGMALGVLLVTAVRRLLFVNIVEEYEGEEQAALLDRLNLAFPERRKVSSSLFMQRLTSLAPEELETPEYSKVAFAEIKAMHGVYPVGPWRRIRYSDKAPAGSIYTDQVGNFFNESFLWWNPSRKRFENTFNHAHQLIKDALSEKRWCPTEYDDPIWELVLIFKTLRDACFDSNKVFKGLPDNVAEAFLGRATVPASEPSTAERLSALAEEVEESSLAVPDEPVVVTDLEEYNRLVIEEYKALVMADKSIPAGEKIDLMSGTPQIPADFVPKTVILQQ